MRDGWGQTGLDTRVVPAVNDADSVMGWPRANPVPQKAVKSAAGDAVARLKLKGIGGGAPQGVKPAVQLESTPGILPGDSRVKVKLKTLPDKLRGGAWPSPSCEVSC